MTSQSPLSPAIDLQAKLPPPLHPLIDLAFNFWWSWSADGASIFRDLDAQKWEQCHQNPVEFLAALSDKRLTQFATDRTYLRRVEARRAQLENYLQQPNTWAKEAAPQITPEHPIAYFCVEFGLHQSLPIYAGGLGVLAGDHLKTASDLGLPTIGIGLLYRHGYFKQHFTPQGWQEDEYPDYQAKPLPLELVRTVLALRLTRAANGVSQLNGKVSRQMWSVLYPDRAEEEVPIGAITNGIHARSWIAPLMDDLYSQFLDENWAAKVCDRQMWDKVSEISDREIWRCHQLLKENLIAYVRDWTKRARQHMHMPLPGESLVTFLSDGAFEEQRGSDWAPRWWRAKDCGMPLPIMINNGRRIDQRSTMAQKGGTSWFVEHLKLNHFDPIVIDGKDPGLSRTCGGKPRFKGMGNSLPSEHLSAINQFCLSPLLRESQPRRNRSPQGVQPSRDVARCPSAGSAHARI